MARKLEFEVQSGATGNPFLTVQISMRCITHDGFDDAGMFVHTATKCEHGPFDTFLRVAWPTDLELPMEAPGLTLNPGQQYRSDKLTVWLENDEAAPTCIETLRQHSQQLVDAMNALEGGTTQIITVE